MMTMKNLLPSIWNRDSAPAGREEERLFFPLQREMNRIFDDFFRGWDVAPTGLEGSRFGFFQPSIDVKQSESEIVVKAELPGLDEKDIEVLLTDEALTIRGEKKEEKEEKGKTYYHMERSYGSFNRVIPLPAGVDQKKVQAQYKNGVLSITLQKAQEPKMKSKKISIKGA
jgi:HSP20 family protein